MQFLLGVCLCIELELIWYLCLGLDSFRQVSLKLKNIVIDILILEVIFFSLVLRKFDIVMVVFGLVVVMVDFEMMVCFQRFFIVCVFGEEKLGLIFVEIFFWYVM